MMTKDDLIQFQESLNTTNQPDWLQVLREQASQRWLEKGFPTLRDERWKFTELEALKQMHFSSEKLTANDHQVLLPATIENSLRLVLVDGELVTKHLPTEFYCASLTATLKNHPEKIQQALSLKPTCQDSIYDLNTALIKDGLVILVPDNSLITQPLHIIHLYTQPNEHMLHLRHIIQLGANSQLTVIEHHIGQANLRHFSTVFTQVTLEQDAGLTWHRWQEQGDEAYHINRLSIQQAKASSFLYHGFDLSGRLLRNEIFQEFIGERASCILHGFYLARLKQQIDNYLHIQHAVPHSHSEQYYKGIIDDKAHAVFQGKVVVAPDAQKSEAHQHNANLILSAQAQINTLPQLEIYADDVKCTHGATVGQLDEAALFYLQARGLTPQFAKQILVFGFAAECLQAIENPTLQKFSQSVLDRYFPEIKLFTGELL